MAATTVSKALEGLAVSKTKELKGVSDIYPVMNLLIYLLTPSDRETRCFDLN